jgi:acetyl esterase/lipase
VKTFRTFLYCFRFIIFVHLSPGTIANAVDVADEEPQPRFKVLKEVAYDDGTNERRVFDIYQPESPSEFATLVWFHGGGLTGGERNIPVELMGHGYAIAAAGYRLSPEVKAPDYLDDAAMAVAWIVKNINDFGGDPGKVFVGGYSAGGYLANMVGLDRTWLARYGIDANSLAGIIPISGNTVTHFTIRNERGIGAMQPIVDEFAPLFHVRGDSPPMLLVTGDRELELFGRYEETAYFWRMMKLVGAKSVELYELQGFNHHTVLPPALVHVRNFILRQNEHCKNQPSSR